MPCLPGFTCKREKKWGYVRGPVLARGCYGFSVADTGHQSVRMGWDRQAPLPPQTDLPAGKASPRVGGSAAGRRAA